MQYADLLLEAVPEIVQTARRAGSLERFIDRMIPPKQQMREPRIHYYMYKNGELFGATTSPDRYQGNPDINIVEKKPSRYMIRRWKDYQAKREAFKQQYLDLFMSGILDAHSIDEIRGYNPIYGYIADQIGATMLTWSKWDGPIYPSYAPGMGGRGMEYQTPRGRVFLDFGVDDGTIFLPQIAIENKASGLGTIIMNGLHRYAQEHRLRISIYKVVNHRFFRRFPWLKEDKSGDFDYDWIDDPEVRRNG